MSEGPIRRGDGLLAVAENLRTCVRVGKEAPAYDLCLSLPEPLDHDWNSSMIADGRTYKRGFGRLRQFPYRWRYICTVVAPITHHKYVVKLINGALCGRAGRDTSPQPPLPDPFPNTIPHLQRPSTSIRRCARAPLAWRNRTGKKKGVFEIPVQLVPGNHARLSHLLLSMSA